MQWIEAEDGRLLNTHWIMVIQKSDTDNKVYAIMYDTDGRTDFVALARPIDYLRIKLLRAP